MANYKYIGIQGLKEALAAAAEAEAEAAKKAAEAAKLEAARRAEENRQTAAAEANVAANRMALRFAAETKAYGPKFEAAGLRWAKIVWPAMRGVAEGDMSAIKTIEGRITLGGKTMAARKAILAREAARKAIEVQGRGPMADWAKAEAVAAAREALSAISMACGSLRSVAVIFNGKIVHWGGC